MAAKTFEECAREYLDDKETASEESLRKYLERLELHVFPVLGSMAMASISIGDCKRWQKGLQTKGLSRKTIANTRGESVSPTFERACLPGDDGEPPLRGYNPIKSIPLPRAIPYTRQIFDDTDEAETLITAAYIIDPEIGDLLVTELSVGFRWGEIAGLPVRAMNKRKQTLQVFQVARRYENEWRIEPMPKTEDGFRQVPVADPVWEMLQRRGDGRKTNDFVFFPPSGSPFWLYHNFYKKWRKILELAQAMGFPKHMTPHGLRATLLTWLSSEVDLETLRNIAGHKEVITTYKFYVKNNTRQFGAVKAAVTPLVEVVSGLLRPRTAEPQQPASSRHARPDLRAVA
ncbi:tyrosine-type recombinase/integrase [Dactylosporangium matsuzakiense]|uniref:Tyr recombinase domain-containing protein n=1 Tax=Dactylosporangium matsuzakiense TaxID=53360 RepID=A0A9W6KEZ8_9ACTN|nr:site-specific integrase [Dactylosporangium matsuzakiense]UWZ45674.1 tyrosine-type recombinase/integrase [Dactylosporangium matsuzakiense]GLL00308.1 hypothetical protein GCM10017581_020480 [Dactylosporangium matsuzakiense]